MHSDKPLKGHGQRHTSRSSEDFDPTQRKTEQLLAQFSALKAKAMHQLQSAATIEQEVALLIERAHKCPKSQAKLKQLEAAGYFVLRTQLESQLMQMVKQTAQLKNQLTQMTLPRRSVKAGLPLSQSDSSGYSSTTGVARCARATRLCA